jgi:hypothetical protein
VDQRDAAAAESGVIGLPEDRDVADGLSTARRDQADPVRFHVPGQVPPRPGLAVTDPPTEKPDGRLGITLIHVLDGNTGKSHGTILAYATERLSLERGHRHWLSPARVGKAVTIPLALRTPWAIDLAIGERPRDRCSSL